MRGLAIAAVLFYHGGFSWARGGYLGVSMFFTISGFLIARLIRAEYARRGGLRLGSFWLRRARRLLPAALIVLAAIAIVHGAFEGVSPQRLRGDVFAALAYIENWWLIHTQQIYTLIFGQASPVQHFWSLSIEEQFYLVFPLLCLGMHRFLRRRAYIAGVFAVLATGSFTLALSRSLNGDFARAYYGTDSRAGELLVGVTLAYLLAIAPTHHLSARRVLDGAGFACLAGLLVLWYSVGLESAFLFRGGTLLNASFTAGLLVACLQAGHTAAVCSVRPLRALGRVSYSVYLVHWPVFLWLTAARLSWNTPLLFGARVVVTFALAIPLYRLVESPIRRRVRMRGWRFAPALATGIVGVVGVTALLPASAAVVDVADAPTSVSHQLTSLRAAHTPPNVRRVLVVGDSVAWSLWIGLHQWGRAHAVDVQFYVAVGCGIGGAGTLDYLGIVRNTSTTCDSWSQGMSDAVTSARPDVVLVVDGLADLSPREFAVGNYANIGDPDFDAFLAQRITAMDTTLRSTGAHVLWTTYPHVRVPYAPGSTGHPPFVESDPARVDRLNSLVSATIASLPASSMLDLASYCRTRPGGEFDSHFRIDGVHFSTAGSLELSAQFGPQLLRSG